MGRPKKEMKKIHQKKVKKAKEKVKSHIEGKTSFSELSQRAKKFLKRLRKVNKQKA